LAAAAGASQNDQGAEANEDISNVFQDEVHLLLRETCCLVAIYESILSRRLVHATQPPIHPSYAQS
jgi:hypothetical protein